MNRPILDVLKVWKKEQAAHCLKSGIPASGFVFTQDNGEMMHLNSLSNYCNRFGKKYGFPGFHPHACRHTMASIMITNGVDPVTVSQKSGHATPTITLNVYSHANEAAQRRGNEALANKLYRKA